MPSPPDPSNVKLDESSTSVAFSPLLSASDTESSISPALPWAKSTMGGWLASTSMALNSSVKKVSSGLPDWSVTLLTSSMYCSPSSGTPARDTLMISWVSVSMKFGSSVTPAIRSLRSVSLPSPKLKSPPAAKSV